jgi:hypothetical protein
MDMMRSLFTSEWTAPGPSAVPSFNRQLAGTLALLAFVITVHAGVAVFGI